MPQRNCFDPDYDWLPLDAFEPMMRRVFAKATQARIQSQFASRHGYEAG